MEGEKSYDSASQETEKNSDLISEIKTSPEYPPLGIDSAIDGEQFVNKVLGKEKEEKKERKPSAEEAFLSTKKEGDVLSIVRNIDAYEWDSKNLVQQIIKMPFGGFSEKKYIGTFQNLLHTVALSPDSQRLSEILFVLKDERVRDVLLKKTGQDGEQLIKDWLKGELESVPNKNTPQLLAALIMPASAFPFIDGFVVASVEKIISEPTDPMLVQEIVHALYAKSGGKLFFLASQKEELSKKYPHAFEGTEKKKIGFDEPFYKTDEAYRKKVNSAIEKNLDSIDTDQLLTKLRMGNIHGLHPSVLESLIKNGADVSIVLMSIDVTPPAFVPMPNIFKIIASSFTPPEQAKKFLQSISRAPTKDISQTNFLSQMYKNKETLFSSDVLLLILSMDRVKGRFVELEYGFLFQKEGLSEHELSKEGAEHIEKLYPSSEGGIENSFIKQGSVGSCYLLGSLDAIKKHAPDFFRDFVIKNIKQVEINEHAENEVVESKTEQKEKSGLLSSFTSSFRKKESGKTTQENIQKQEQPPRQIIATKDGWEVSFSLRGEKIPVQVSQQDIYTWLVKESGIQAPLGDQIIEAAYAKFRTTHLREKTISGGHGRDALNHLLGSESKTAFNLEMNISSDRTKIQSLLENFANSSERYIVTVSVNMGAPLMRDLYGGAEKHGHGLHLFSLQSYNPETEEVSIANPWDSREKTVTMSLNSFFGKSYSGVYQVEVAEFLPSASKLNRFSEKLEDKSPEEIKVEIAKKFALFPVSDILSSKKDDFEDAEKRLATIIESTKNETTRNELQKALLVMQKLKDEEKIKEHYKKEANIS